MALALMPILCADCVLSYLTLERTLGDPGPTLHLKRLFVRVAKNGDSMLDDFVVNFVSFLTVIKFSKSYEAFSSYKGF